MRPSSLTRWLAVLVSVIVASYAHVVPVSPPSASHAEVAHLIGAGDGTTGDVLGLCSYGRAANHCREHSGATSSDAHPGLAFGFDPLFREPHLFIYARALAAEGGAGSAEPGPSFITNSNGETIPVPEGATGPSPATSGKGFQFTGGSGGSWLNPRVAGVRVMESVTSGKYLYPNGYVSYFNDAGQTVNPFTGQTISRFDPFWHWEWGW